MRRRIVWIVALSCIAGSASTAQSGKDSIAAHASPLDRWITKPTVIVLTALQPRTVDSLDIKYRDDAKRIFAAASRDEQSAVVGMRALNSKYIVLVRAILTTEQQAIFDKNLKAPITPGGSFPRGADLSGPVGQIDSAPRAGPQKGRAVAV